MAHREACETDVSNFIATIDWAIYNINKNLGQMDFDNVDARERMNEIAGEMVKLCESLKEKMNTYTFE